MYSPLFVLSVALGANVGEVAAVDVDSVPGEPVACGTCDVVTTGDSVACEAGAVVTAACGGFVAVTTGASVVCARSGELV